MTEPDDAVVHQTHCVYCLCEQHAGNVAAFSRGQTGCSICGVTAPVFRDRDAYLARLRERRAANEFPINQGPRR